MKGKNARKKVAVRTESSKRGKFPVGQPSASGLEAVNPIEHHYGLGDLQNMQRYEEYSDSRYSYNPYRDYSDGRMRSDMRKRPQLKSAVYRRCRNLVTGEKSTFRKTAMSV